MPFTDFTIDLDPVAQDNSLIGGDHAAYWPLPSRRYSRSDYKFAARRYTPEPGAASYTDPGNNLVQFGDPSNAESWSPVAGSVRSSRRENILFPSEDFTSTRYVKSGATLAAGSIVNGKQFTRFIPNAGTGAKILNQIITIDPKPYDRWFTHQIVIKADSANTVRFAMLARDSIGQRGFVYFRLAAGTVGGNNSFMIGALTALADGYFLATLSVLVRATSTQVFFGLYAANPALDSTTNFNFNGTDAYLISAGQTEIGMDATAYIKTVEGPVADPGTPGYLSTAATIFTTTAASGNAVAEQTTTAVTITPGKTYNVHALVKKGTMEKTALISPVAGEVAGETFNKYCGVRLDFNAKTATDLSDGSDLYLATSSRGVLDIPGGWLLVYYTFVAPAGSLNTPIILGTGLIGDTEAAGRNFYADHIHIEERAGLPVGYNDGAVATKGTIIYLHGSGANEFLATDHPIVTGLNSRGYDVLQILDLGFGISSPTPFRYGYGNVNAPHFASYFTKTAIFVEAAYKFMLADNDKPFLFLGQSRGAAAALAWAARQLGRDNFDPRCKGVLSCGATVAGLGDFTWNDMNRNINTMSGIVAELRLPAIIAAGDRDQFAPPSYNRRLQLSAPANPGVYFVSPGDTDHYWLRDPNFAPLAIMWAEQLFNEQPITERDGVTFAVPGAAIPVSSPNPLDGGGTGGVAVTNNSQVGITAFWPTNNIAEDPEILYYKNPKTRVQPGSVTKILTALSALKIAAERSIPLTQTFTVSGFDITSGSGNNLKVNDVLTFSDLLHDLFLPSSNTAATTIARNFGRFLIGSGTEASASYNAFMDYVNEYAASIGMLNSKFLNPHGLAVTGQWVNGRDLVLAVREAGKNATISTIWKKTSANITVTGANARTIAVTNTNTMAGDSDVLGGKTGTVGSIYNLAIYSQAANGGFMATVVLQAAGSNGRFADARRIIDAVNATLT